MKQINYLSLKLGIKLESHGGEKIVWQETRYINSCVNLSVTLDIQHSIETLWNSDSGIKTLSSSLSPASRHCRAHCLWYLDIVKLSHRHLDKMLSSLSHSFFLFNTIFSTFPVYSTILSTWHPIVTTSFIKPDHFNNTRFCVCVLSIRYCK